MIKASYVQQLRKNLDFTQEYVADKIGVSRPTYSQIEKGERELTISEAENLAKIYDLTLDDLLAGRAKKLKIKIVGESKKEIKKDMEIRVQRKNIDKFKEVLLYILEKIGAKPNVGETVIYKLLYFIDFDYFEKFEENLIGATYIRNHHGPTPVEFKDIVEEMKKKGEIEMVKSKYFQFEQKKYLPRRRPELTMLNAREISHIDNVLDRLSDKSAKELSEYSHGDVPWKSHKEGEKIDYESVFYRDDKYSVRTYDDEL